MNRPLELAHYFTTNDVFPPSGLPTLNSYLAQLTTSIESVESEILKLRAFLHAKKQEKCGLEQEYTTCVGIKSPIRRLPVEILGLIFSFAVGAAPFNRYIHITHLRGVCSSWRHAATTTPGLWTSLTIDLDRWAPPYSQFLSDVTLLDQFKEELSPWIAILSRTRPIHLTLTSRSFEDDIEINDPGFNRKRKLAGHLLSMTPPPATLTLNSPLALLAAILANAPGVVEIEVSYEATRGLEGFTILEARFPCLKALKIHGSLAIDTPPFPHSSLQTLHLGRGIRPDFFLQELLCTLPCLRELKLGFPDHLDLWNPPDVPETTYVHCCLEILIIEGENQLFTLTGISFPRLRLLDISGCAHAAIPDEIVASHFHPDTFARSQSEPLLVSLSGDFPQALLIRLLASLPPASHLYLNIGLIENRDQWSDDDGALPIPIQSDNVEEIFCGRESLSLWWLHHAIPARNKSSRSMKIYLPTGLEGWEHGYLRRDELRELNFELQPLPNESLNAMLRSLAPPLSKYAAGWWDPHLVWTFRD